MILWRRFTFVWRRDPHRPIGLPVAVSQNDYAFMVYLGPVLFLMIKRRFLESPAGFAELCELMGVTPE